MPVSRQALRLLLAEDDASTAMVLTRMLHLLGHEVLGTVATGGGAIEQSRIHRPDFVLVDIGLAGSMDGIGASTRIRDELGIPTIYVTPGSDDGALHRATRTSPFGYILKPLNKLQLQTSLEVAAQLRRHYKELQESEHLWRSMLNGGTEGVWDWDVQSGRVSFSRRWKDILGFDDQEIGTSLDELTDRIYEEDKARFESALTEHIRLRTSGFRVEVRVRCKDGTLKWVSDRGKVIHWMSDGSPGRILGARSDISDLKKAQHALVEERTLLRTLMDILPVHIYVKDSQHRFLLCNRACAHDLGGCEPEQMVGKTDLDFFPSDLARRSIEEERHIFATGEPFVDHGEATTDNFGRDKWVTTTKVAWRNSTGEVTKILGVTRDSIERTKMEDDLREQREMVRAISTSLR